MIGVLSHGAGAGAFARDVLCFLGGWLGAGFAVGLYARPAWARLAATWLGGVVLAVLVRALLVGHGPAADFAGVALAFTLLFALAARAAASVRR